MRIRRTILHLDDDASNETPSLSLATLDFKIERAKQKFAAGSLEEAFYECWKIPQEQRPLEIWKLGGECCKKLRLFAVAQRWFSEAIHACRSHNTDLNVKLEQARIARFFSTYLAQYPMIDIRVDQRGKGFHSSRLISWSSSWLISRNLCQTCDIAWRRRLYRHSSCSCPNRRHAFDLPGLRNLYHLSAHAGCLLRIELVAYTRETTATDRRLLAVDQTVAVFALLVWVVLFRSVSNASLG